MQAPDWDAAGKTAIVIFAVFAFVTHLTAFVIGVACAAACK